MILAFYKVNNSIGLKRHSFDYETDGKKVLETLSQLPDEEYKLYDMSVYGYGNLPSPNAADFEDDYNNEELDGGWWCVVIRNEKD